MDNNMELKLNNNIHDVMTVASILVRQGYKTTIQRIMKKYR